MMFRADSSAEAVFRAEVRGWLVDNLPESLRFRALRPPPEALMAWHRTLYGRGWAAPHWPKEYGGMGATLNQQLILGEELARLGAPPLHAPGPNFLAPALMEFGTEAQKRRHLPGIVSGEVIWAQGYSEPGAGSDLASLRVRAERVGDNFIVNGQKIWNTWAHHADWMFALVRTDPDARPRHAGISMLLFPLDLPGVTAQGIDTIAGDDELATVFLDDVAVPAENLLGPLNGGWKVANHVLSFERVNTANPMHCIGVMERVRQVARETGMIGDAGFRDRMAQAEIDILTISAIFNHAIEIQNGGGVLGPDSSIMKIVGTETLQRLSDLLVEAAAGAGADAGEVATGGGPVEVTPVYLVNRRATIYGGSSEIQRNVIAKRVLGLPS